MNHSNSSGSNPSGSNPSGSNPSGAHPNGQAAATRSSNPLPYLMNQLRQQGNAKLGGREDRDRKVDEDRRDSSNGIKPNGSAADEELAEGSLRRGD